MGRKQRVRNSVSVNVTVGQHRGSCSRKSARARLPRNARASSAGRGSKQTRTIGEATRWRTLPPDERRRTYFAVERAEIVVAAGAEVTTVALHACVGAKAPHGAAHDRRIDAIVEADVLEIRRILVQRDRTTTELAALEDLTARGTIATRARRKRP